MIFLFGCISKRASTEAESAPVLIQVFEALQAERRLSACRMMDLPAPVSPVSTVNEEAVVSVLCALKAKCSDLIRARLLIFNSRSIILVGYVRTIFCPIEFDVVDNLSIAQLLENAIELDSSRN